IDLAVLALDADRNAPDGAPDGALVMRGADPGPHDLADLAPGIDDLAGDADAGRAGGGSGVGVNRGERRHERGDKRQTAQYVRPHGASPSPPQSSLYARSPATATSPARSASRRWRRASASERTTSAGRAAAASSFSMLAKTSRWAWLPPSAGKA